MWPFGSTPKKRVTRSKGELAQIAAEHRTAERGYFSSGGGGKRRLAASGGSAKRSTGTTYQGYAIKRTEEGEYVIPRTDARFTFRFPGGCESVPEVVETEPVFPARWDIENSQGGNWQTVGSVRADSAKEALSRYRGEHPEWSKGRKLRARAQRGNPADAAAAKYEEFHGRPSEETVTVKREIHYHKHLASLGKLKKLVVVSREGYNVPIDRLRVRSCARTKRERSCTLKAAIRRWTSVSSGSIQTKRTKWKCWATSSRCFISRAKTTWEKKAGSPITTTSLRSRTRSFSTTCATNN